MRDADWGAELDRVGRGEQPGDRRASPVELQLHAPARNLLLVSAMLLALYGVGIRIDIDPAQARALGPLVLLRPWFLEVLGWAGFFLAGYRFWACYRPHRSIDRELQARRFSRSEQAWELITRQCIEHNVFPESRQLKLATVAGNQRQLEAMARMFLKVPGPLPAKVGVREEGDVLELHFPDLRVEYRSFDAARTHTQQLGAIDLPVASNAFGAALADARRPLRPGDAEYFHCRLPLLVAVAMLGVLLLRVSMLLIHSG